MNNNKRSKPDHSEQDNEDDDILIDTVIELQSEVARLRKENEGMSIALKTALDVVSEMNKRLAEVEKRQQTTSQTPYQGRPNYANMAKTGMNKDAVVQVERRLTLRVVQEQKQQEERKSNVVLFGMPVSTKPTVQEKQQDDESKVNMLFRTMKQTAPKNITRNQPKVGVTTPPPIIIRLDNESARKSVLVAARTLQTQQGLSTYFFSPDLTVAEREQNRELRQRRNELNNRNELSRRRYAIRDGRLVKFKKSPEQLFEIEKKKKQQQQNIEIENTASAKSSDMQTEQSFADRSQQQIN